MEESSCHPALLLGDVLEVMFNQLPFEELKECRLVCRKWEEASKILMKKQSKLELTRDIQRNFRLGEFLRRDFHFFIPSKLNINIPWNMEIKEREGLKDIYGILGQHSFEELEVYGGTPDQLFNILGLLSTSLKSLEIWRIAKYPILTRRQIQDICPLLTKLSVGNVPQWIHNSIFATCPNLIEVNGDDGGQLAVLEKSSENLRKISGFVCSTKEDMEILERKSENLAELNLEVEEGVGVSILEFVQSKKERLTLLELKFQEVPKILRLGQGFSQLTKLHLQMDYYATTSDGGQWCLDICFSRDTPQLKYFKLAVNDDEDQNWKDFLAYRSNIGKGGRVIPLRTLTHLDLSVEVWAVRECADYLRQLFPSLIVFKIHGPSEDFLQGLWQMESLVKISIDLVTHEGGDWRDYGDIEDMGAALFGTLEDQELEESILNLKRLRYLSIRKLGWNVNGNRIPEEIVRTGFGNMKRLSVLDLPHFEMTREGKAFLWANLPYLKQND